MSTPRYLREACEVVAKCKPLPDEPCPERSVEMPYLRDAIEAWKTGFLAAVEKAIEQAVEEDIVNQAEESVIESYDTQPLAEENCAPWCGTEPEEEPTDRGVPLLVFAGVAVLLTALAFGISWALRQFCGV